MKNKEFCLEDCAEERIKSGRSYREIYVKEAIKSQFELIEELLSVEDAMKLEKELIKLWGKRLTNEKE